jgi:hypothetical protein
MQFHKAPDISYLEVIYNDGTVRKYSAQEGTLIEITQTDAIDLTLYETFYTDNFRISSPLHGAPTAYCVTTGEPIRELEQDAFLTHVTQVGQYVITEYISLDGQRFGLLIDGQTAEPLAYSPNLTDIIGNRLIVNDRESGTLRETRLFLESELVEMARGMLENFG